MTVSLGEPHQYLTFMLGPEMYALGILTVKEIIEFTDPTPVPNMPAYVRGVINLRGAVVPVVDLLARFGRPSSERTRRSCIVIVEVSAGGGQQDAGIFVDAVNSVLDIAESDIEPRPAFGARSSADCIRGLGKVNGRFVILLDIDQIVSSGS
jgi:purine-binding chemotaxis protein CheW